MINGAEKIRVLLLDDNPSSLNLIEEIDGVPCDFPQVSDSATTEVSMPELEEFFELRWLASAAEAREFRDLSLLVSRTTPEALIREGWIPEIFCFDYALTGKDNPIEQRFFPDELTNRLSPLSNLRRYVTTANLSTLKISNPPHVNVAQGDDNYGCFAGGLIFTAFSDHPCGPVALTRKGDNKTAGTEASFFEWMLESEVHGTFTKKGRPEPQWRELIPDGITVLRSRIEELARGSIIRVSLDDLIALSASGKHEVLTIRSRYGLRRLPVRALFLDYKPSQREEAARNWAVRVLDKIFSGTEADFKLTLDDFMQGRNLAQILWTAYDSDDLVKRLRLSELLARNGNHHAGKPPAEEQSELEELKRYFGVDDVEARSMCGANYVDIRNERFSDRQKRWAALIIIVLLLARSAKVRNKLQGERHTESKQSGYDYNICQPLQAADVYLALFPLARDPLILPFHGGRDPGSQWGKPLTRLNDPRRGPSLRDNWGNIALKVYDVLNGLPWNEDAQQPKDTWTYGLMPGERQVLQHFAHSIGFGDDEWEKDSQAREILKPLGR
ncbi:MAG TPA: hypothetical protein VF290_08480 [Pyrinomonadaceae bacterium]